MSYLSGDKYRLIVNGKCHNVAVTVKYRPFALHDLNEDFAELGFRLEPFIDQNKNVKIVGGHGNIRCRHINKSRDENILFKRLNDVEEINNSFHCVCHESHGRYDNRGKFINEVMKDYYITGLHIADIVNRTYMWIEIYPLYINPLRKETMKRKVDEIAADLLKKKNKLSCHYIQKYHFNLEDTWKYIRYLWIGHLKEGSNCLLSILPRDMIREINQYL